MPESYLHHYACAEVSHPATEAELADLKQALPRAAVRRMSLLGLRTLANGSYAIGVEVGPADCVLYATAFSETRALEKYLEGFPTPSPLLFQSSIHPSAIEQVLIARQQGVGAFFPLAGDPKRIDATALHAVFSSTGARTLLVCGEEQGTWLMDPLNGSRRDLACLAVFSPDPVGALACLRWTPASLPDACPADRAHGWHDALARRHDLCLEHPAGHLHFSWI